MTQRANDRQVGGLHYKKQEYQHWDFVCDTNLRYLIACASKYVSRWRGKNGLEDLRKSIHYLEKSIERLRFGTDGSLYAPTTTYQMRENMAEYSRKVNDFAIQFSGLEAAAIVAMCHGYYEVAIKAVEEIIAVEVAATPTLPLSD